MWRPLKLSAPVRVSYLFLTALCEQELKNFLLINICFDLVSEENQPMLEITDGRRSSKFSCGKTDLEILLFNRNRISCSGPQVSVRAHLILHPISPFLYFVFFSACPSWFSPLRSIRCLSDGISNINYQSLPFDWFSHSVGLFCGKFESFCFNLPIWQLCNNGYFHTGFTCQFYIEHICSGIYAQYPRLSLEGHVAIQFWNDLPISLQFFYCFITEALYFYPISIQQGLAFLLLVASPEKTPNDLSLFGIFPSATSYQRSIEKGNWRLWL